MSDAVIEPGMTVREAIGVPAPQIPGVSYVDETIHSTRLEICKACDVCRVDWICEPCGCWVPQKAWMPHEVCPLDKW